MIDTPIFFFYIETMHNLIIFARFQSIFSMTVWNTIDDRYSIFPLYRNEATFLAFAPFQSISSMTVWNTIDDRSSNFFSSI